ncbi:DNA mismatch repair protein MutL [Peribacillus simplex]|uniref:DNA mismatch repair endonuclease MutL n=1 Tax=Peribacillus simplex TaxID=1478 RepID=UPI0035C769B4|nr:DNA mismatch repair protein MutL [Peribacillus simplex]
MGKIIQLDEALSNKIAAGEVVERPASVVKELVENAIDANSTIIEIELVEAGLGSIRIVDNGDGILADDIEAAFKRHATSKIKDENDLFRIRTLGFRGEAMPSIASVSRFELKSSTGEGVGTRILLEGGMVKELEASSSRKGTDILVSDLFYNTPARLKYMKTIHTELGNITDVANRLALSHPDVSIRLSHNEKRILHTNGNGDVRQVLAAIYGTNIAKKMIPIQASSLDFKLSGYIVMPEVTRASRNYISTMINGRFIKNYALVKAILDGYHTLLPIGRFPIALLNIEMDPILVDVNVHPSKMEVRLSKEQELYSLLSETIKSAFKKLSLIPSGYTPAPKPEQVKSEQTTLDLDHVVEKGKRILEEAKKEASLLKDTLIREKQGQKNYEDHVEEVNLEPIKELIYSNEQQQMGDAYIPVLPEDERKPYFESAEKYTTYTVEQEEEIEEDESESRIPPMYPIGQMHGTYIFAQNEKGLYIIDQHAAQERIKYEYFKEKVGRVENELQDMLVPITLEFSTDQCIRINEYRHELERVGVFLEEFGYNAYIVRSHPQWFP